VIQAAGSRSAALASEHYHHPKYLEDGHQERSDELALEALRGALGQDMAGQLHPSSLEGPPAVLDLGREELLRPNSLGARQEDLDLGARHHHQSEL
jgi:hypothetical protein